jgi:hypothetical protein
MLDFIFTVLSGLCVGGAAVFGFFSWLFPGLPIICRRKARRRIVTFPRWLRITLSVLMTLLFAVGLSLYVVNQWTKIQEAKAKPYVTQLRDETFGTAKSIMSDLKQGDSAMDLQTRYDRLVYSDIIPKLRANTAWTNDVAYSVSLNYWTNLALALSNAAKRLPK